MMCWLSQLAKIYADSGCPRFRRSACCTAAAGVLQHGGPCKPLAWCSGKKVPEGPLAS